MGKKFKTKVAIIRKYNFDKLVIHLGITYYFHINRSMKAICVMLTEIYQSYFSILLAFATIIKFSGMRKYINLLDKVSKMNIILHNNN